MNKQQEHWLNYYLESGDDIRAVEVAYPDVSQKNRSSKASALRAALSEEIDRASRNLYGTHAPKMQKVIMELALNGKQEAVRGKMADLWLSRAGHDQALVIETKASATHEELLKRLKIAMSGLPEELINAALPIQLVAALKEDKDIETTH